MWTYTNISREDFEIKKNQIENIMIYCGALPIECHVTHEVSTFGRTVSDTIISDRTIYEYNGNFFRVDEVLFPAKPFIVIEWTDNIEYALNNVMEDTDPFPFDLTNEELIKEIEFILSKDRP